MFCHATHNGVCDMRYGFMKPQMAFCVTPNCINYDDFGSKLILVFFMQLGSLQGKPDQRPVYAVYARSVGATIECSATCIYFVLN